MKKCHVFASFANLICRQKAEDRERAVRSLDVRERSETKATETSDRHEEARRTRKRPKG
jgi:hypothetical protein